MGLVQMISEDDEWDWEQDWTDPYADMSEEEKKGLRQWFYEIDMHEIENAKNRKEYYNGISDLIKYVHDFNDQQIIRLAELIKKEWKPKRGARTKEDRDNDIWSHWRIMNIDGNSMTRQEMIEYIITTHKVTVDAATKIFNKIK